MPPREPGLVGREAEVTAARTAIESARNGSGMSLLLEGEAGIGKTSLADVMLGLATNAGFQAIQARGVRSGGVSPYGTLHDVLRSMLGRVDALPARQRTALDVVFGRAFGDAPDKLVLGLATLGLIEETAQDAPLVIVIDDLHWVDPSSAGVIAFIASRLEHSGTLLIATTRTGPGYESRASAFGHALALAPLTETQAHDVIKAHAAKMPLHTRTRIVRAAFGNPLALAELARQRALALSGGRPAAAPDRLRDAFLAEVYELPADTQKALLVAAAGENSSTNELTEALRQLSLGPGALAPAERATLLRVDGDTYSFRHPLIGSSLYEAADTGSKLDVHNALALAARTPSRRAHHRAAATTGWNEEVASELDNVAEEASVQGAAREAYTAWRRAAALSPEVASQASRLVRAAEAARQSGASTDAAALLDEARTIIDRTDADTQHRFGRAEWVLSMTADYRGRSAQDLLAASRGIVDDGKRLETLMWAATKCYIHQERAEVREEVAEALRAQIGRGDEVLIDIAVALVDTGRQIDDETVDRFLARARATDGILINCLAFAAEEAGDMALADRVWSAAVRLFHEAGRPSDETTALCGRSSPRISAGRLPAGVADAEQSLSLSQEVDLPVVSAMSLAEIARGRARAGDAVGTLAALKELENYPASAAFARVAATASWASGIIATFDGRFHDALADYEHTRANGAVALWAGGDFAEAALRAGRPEALDDWTRTVRAALASTGSKQLELLLERVTGQLAADDEEAVAHLERAIEIGESPDTDLDLDLGYAHLILGERLRRMRQIVNAREHLRQAVMLLDRGGAHATAVRAAGELRAAGERTAGPRGVPTDRSETLTAQELLVSRLAADGLSNKEIADEVYLSHKTVGAHLSRAFQKLGVSRRSQLASALAGGADTDEGIAS